MIIVQKKDTIKKILYAYIVVQILLLWLRLIIHEFPIFFHTALIGSVVIPLFAVFLSYESGIKHFVKGLTLWVIIVVIFLLGFRELRRIFTVPEISSQKIVSFSHYFAYPIYFDLTLFIIFLLLPGLILCGLKIISKKNKK